MHRFLVCVQVVFDVLASHRTVAAIVVGTLLCDLPDNRVGDLVSEFECFAFYAVGTVVA